VIVGIVSQINSGKDTVAQMLGEEFSFVRMAFADPLKEFVLQMFPDQVDRDMLYGPSDKRKPARELLQQLGTDIARRFDPLVWVKHTKRRIQHLRETGEDCLGLLPDCRPTVPIVLSDVRFRNEARFVYEDRAGFLVDLVRPGNYDKDGIEEAYRSHESETQKVAIPEDWYRYRIVNDGSLDDLRQAVRNIIISELKNG
jgi:hypothetical protein